MNRTLTIARLRQSARALACQPKALPPAAPVAATERAELAQELARAFADELARYRQSLGTRHERLDPTQPPSPCDVDALLKKPPEDTHFADLERLAQVDPSQSLHRWEEIKQVARMQLANGWRAGRALEFAGGSAWERAGFLALRNGLCEAFPPRNIAEKTLIDEIAQYEMLRQKWVEVLAMHSRIPAAGIRQSGGDRKLSAVDATDEATRMIERLQRFGHNALRLLLKIRGEKRSAAEIVWLHANLGEQIVE